MAAWLLLKVNPRLTQRSIAAKESAEMYNRLQHDARNKRRDFFYIPGSLGIFLSFDSFQ